MPKVGPVTAGKSAKRKNARVLVREICRKIRFLETPPIPAQRRENDLRMVGHMGSDPLVSTLEIVVVVAINSARHCHHHNQQQRVTM